MNWHASHVVSLVAFLIAAPAHAQFRPGSSPDGGRVGAVCNQDLFTPFERRECTKMMRNAKNDAQRAEVKALVEERLKERRKEYDADLEKNERNIRPNR